MKYYLEYLFENESAYRRAFFFSVLFFLITFGIIIATIINSPQNEVEGEVQIIEKGQISRKNNTSFEIEQQYHYDDVIYIVLDAIPYTVETNFRHRWDEVLEKVKVGDKVSIIYATSEGNRIRQLEKGTLTILDSNELKQSFVKFRLVLIILSITLLSYILILFFKRRSYAKKTNTLYKPHDGGL